MRTGQMTIGGMRIDPLLDGECLATPAASYCNHDADPSFWNGHEDHLDPYTDKLVYTLGGYLIRYDDRVVVVDTGVGPQPKYPFVGGAFRSALHLLRVHPTEVTDVIFTHLHLDHIGWASVEGQAFFPNATYRMDQRDFDHFCAPDYVVTEWEATRSYPERDAAKVRLAPVMNQMEFFIGDDSVIPGIAAIEASGHTPGTTVLKLTSDGEHGMMLGDVAHSVPELTEEGIAMRAHMDMDRAMESLDRVRKTLVDSRIPLAAAHFPGLPWGVLKQVPNGTLGFERIT